jgi:hypothetical protein
MQLRRSTLNPPQSTRFPESEEILSSPAFAPNSPQLLHRKQNIKLENMAGAGGTDDRVYFTLEGGPSKLPLGRRFSPAERV